MTTSAIARLGRVVLSGLRLESILFYSYLSDVRSMKPYSQHMNSTGLELRTCVVNCNGIIVHAGGRGLQFVNSSVHEHYTAHEVAQLNCDEKSKNLNETN